MPVLTGFFFFLKSRGVSFDHSSSANAFSTTAPAKTIPENLKLFPVAICMSETKLRNRKDTIVVWFKPSEELKKALPENVKIEDYLKVPVRTK